MASQPLGNYVPGIKEGTVKVQTSELEEGDDFSGAAEIVNAIPTADQEDGVTIWNDNGVLKVSTSGL